MAQYLLDTDILTLAFHQHERVTATIVNQIKHVAISIITVDEVIQGWQKAIRQASSTAEISKHYHHYAEAIFAFQHFHIIGYDEQAIERYLLLKGMKLNVDANDLRIGAIALENNLKVITRNLRDFQRIPGLTIEDWSK